MEKWTINGRKYFAAPTDTPEIRQWLADLPNQKTFELINSLCWEWNDLGRNSRALSDPEGKLADWHRCRVIDEIERRIEAGSER